MKLNRLIFKLVLTIAVLVFTESSFSQIIQTTVTDSVSKEIPKITVVDSISKQIPKITVADSISKETPKITVVDSISKETPKITVVDSLSKEPKRLKFGVGFGLSFIGGTNISLAPNLMYKLSDKISIGAGIQGSYSAIKNLQNTTTFGGNVITQYTPIRQISALIEFAELNVSTKTETPTGKIKDNYWDAALFLGAGFNVTNKISIGAKYNVLYKEDESVYTSPIIPFVNISF